MIRIKSLKIHNFGYIKDADVKFPTQDLVFVAGEYHKMDGSIASNGAGKSNFIEALWYALTGDVIRKMNVAKVIGRFDGYAETDLRLANADHEYRIIRKRTPTGATTNFYVDKQPKSARNTRMTEEVIQREFGVDWNLFRYTNYIPQEDAQSGFVYSNEADRKALIGKLFAAEFFDKILELVKKNLKKIRLEQEQVQLQIAEKDGEITQVRAQIDSLKTKIADAKIQNQKAQGELDIDDAYLDEIERKYVKVCRVLMDKRTEKHKLESDLRILNQEHRDVAAIYTDHVATLKQHQDDMNRILDELRPLKQAIKNPKLCPTCEQLIGKKEIKSLKIKANKKIAEYKSIEELCPSIESKIEDLEKQSEKYESKTQSLNEKIIEVEETRDNYHEIQKALIAEKNEIIGVKAKVADLEPMKQMLAENRANIKTLLSEHMECSKSFEDLKKREDRYKIWERGYSHGIRSMAFESVIDQFTQEVAARLKEICGADLMIRFDTKTVKDEEVKDKFSIEVMDADAQEWKDVLLASVGQRRIVSMAVTMAMHTMSRPKLAIHILDEALENVDPIISQGAHRALRELSKESTVLFVTHQESVPDGERKFTAVRQNGVVSIS